MDLSFCVLQMRDMICNVAAVGRADHCLMWHAGLEEIPDCCHVGSLTHSASCRWGASFLKWLQWLEDHMHDLKCPLLTLHGTGDKLTHCDGSRMLVDKASSKDKTLKVRITLLCAHRLIQTRKRFKIMLFIMTKHNMQILGVISFIKLQNSIKKKKKLQKAHRLSFRYVILVIPVSFDQHFFFFLTLRNTSLSEKMLLVLILYSSSGICLGSLFLFCNKVKCKSWDIGYSYWLFWLGCVCYWLCFTQNCEPALHLYFDGLHFDMIRSNCEYVIHPDVAPCGWQDINNPKTVTNLVVFASRFKKRTLASCLYIYMFTDLHRVLSSAALWTRRRWCRSQEWNCGLDLFTVQICIRLTHKNE